MGMMMLLNIGQHPMTLTHNVHSPTYQSSWHGFLFAGLFNRGNVNHKSARRPLIQDWVFAPNCDALLRGDTEEVHYTKRMLYREVRDKVTDTEYYEMTKSCADFRATEGYSPVPLSHEEANFPIAYIIQSYKNVEQLNRLLKTIYAPQNPYCICVNHKATPDFDRSVKLISNCFNNIFHASTLKFSRSQKHDPTELDDITCARKCMKVLLGADWKYVIKIHSQDYPLVTAQYVTAKLKNLERLKIPFISDYSHMLRKQSVKVVLGNHTVNGSMDSSVVTDGSKDITLWRGSPYFIASYSIIKQIMDNELTYKLIPTIQTHEHPEAYYWVTLFLHVMGDANHAAIVAANMHRIELLTHKKLHTKQYCAGVTQLLDHCILGVEDLGKLFHAHQHQFYAHGFDLDRDHIAYSCLEQRIADAVSDYSGNLTLTFNDRALHATQPEIKLIANDKSLDALAKSVELPKISADVPRKSAEAPKKSVDALAKSAVAPRKSADAPEKYADAPGKSTNVTGKSPDAPGKSEAPIVPKDSIQDNISISHMPEKVKGQSSNIAQYIEDKMDVGRSIIAKNHTNRVKNATKPDDYSKKISKLAEIVIQQANKDVYRKDDNSKDDPASNKTKNTDMNMNEIDTKRVENSTRTVNDITDNGEEIKSQKIIKNLDTGQTPDQEVNIGNQKAVKQSKSLKTTDPPHHLVDETGRITETNGEVGHQIVASPEDKIYPKMVTDNLEPVTQQLGDGHATLAPTEEIHDLLKSIHAAKHKHESAKLEVDMLNRDDYNNDYVENMDLTDTQEIFKSGLNPEYKPQGKNPGDEQKLSEPELLSNKLQSVDKKLIRDGESVETDNDLDLPNTVR